MEYVVLQTVSSNEAKSESFVIPAPFRDKTKLSEDEI